MRSRRFLFVVVLGALIAAALAAGRGASTRSSAPVRATVVPNASVLSRSSTVWFCPGPPPALPHSGARITFANIGDTTADVVVTDLADSGAVTHTTLQVKANSVVTRARDPLGAPGALTVETFGGRVLVEEGIAGPGAVETTPCATETSAHWYFAAGSTPRGVQQWLVIDNPYASDAKVDVTMRTSSGVRRPDALQGLDVARRSREVIAIHDVAVRLDRVAVEVDAEVGSVVAAQTLTYSTAAGTPGVAQSLGAPATSTDWMFTGQFAHSGASAVVAIANVGTDDAQVDVQATPESGTSAFTPTTLTVAQDAVAWVQLGQCAIGAKACIAIPNGVAYSLDVRSEQNVAIVAQALTRFDVRPGDVGTVTSLGGIEPAPTWAWARTAVSGEHSTTVSLFNPGADPAVVDVAIVRGGAVSRSPSLQQLRVAPGRALTVSVLGPGTSKQPKLDAALIVSANVPIFVERTISAADESGSSAGVVVGT